MLLLSSVSLTLAPSRLYVISYWFKAIFLKMLNKAYTILSCTEKINNNRSHYRLQLLIRKNKFFAPFFRMPGSWSKKRIFFTFSDLRHNQRQSRTHSLLAFFFPLTKKPAESACVRGWIRGRNNATWFSLYFCYCTMEKYNSNFLKH